MKIEWEHTLTASVITALLGLIISYALIFNGFKASADLPKTVPVVVNSEDGKPTRLGALKFESGIKKEITTSKAGTDSAKISSEETLNARNLLFHYNPYLLIWGLTIVILCGLTAGAIPMSCDRIGSIRNKFEIGKKVVGGMILIVAGIGAFMLFGPSLPSYFSFYTFWTPFADVIFEDHGTMKYFVIGILIMALPSLLGMAILFIAGQRLLHKVRHQSEQIKDTFIEEYGAIRNSLSFFLVILTFIISLTVLATGAFRKALLTSIRVEGLDLAPVEFVYLYGVFFTIFLALFYTPVYFQLLSIKQETRDNTDLKVFEKNEALKVSNWETLKILASLMAPLISSILPGVLT